MAAMQVAAKALPLEHLVLAIAQGADDALVGMCGLELRPTRRDAELWYVVDPARWGRGVATAAVTRLLDHAFGQLDLHRVWAHVVPENVASARVLDRLGLRREGLSRQVLDIRGTWHDALLFAVLQEEWLAREVSGSPRDG